MALFEPLQGVLHIEHSQSVLVVVLVDERFEACGHVGEGKPSDWGSSSPDHAVGMKGPGNRSGDLMSNSLFVTNLVTVCKLNP
jgi:hypothetical protein